MSAIQGLLGFFEALIDDPTEEGLAAAVAAHPTAPSALVSYLEARLVRLEPDEAEFEHSEAWWMALEMLVHHFTDADRQALLDRIGLDVASPDANRVLAVFVRAAFPVEIVEPWLVRGIETGTPRQRINASHLAYHLFDGSPGYTPTDEGAARIAAAEARLGAGDGARTDA